MDEIFGLVELSARMLREAELENGPQRSRPDIKSRVISWGGSAKT